MERGEEDNELMARVAQGDKDAFQLLVTRYVSRAHSMAQRVVGSKEDSEDVVQDAFTKVWVQAVRFDPVRATFSTWFYTILSNTALDLLRRRGGKAHPSDVAVEGLVGGTEDQDARMIRVEESGRVRKAVQSLPDKQRIAVVLCYFQELTNQNAAAVMGMHIKALEGLLGRARQKLREWLGEES